VSIVGSSKTVSVSGSLTVPPNAYTIPVPFAVESRSSTDVQALRDELISLGILPDTKIATVTTLAGSGYYGHADGQGNLARFNGPAGVAVDGSGNVFVADSWNNRIRKITPSGNVTTLAGGGAESQGYTDGQGALARFANPIGVAVDKKSGNVFVADSGNHRIRKITANGTVTTLAGSGNYGSTDGQGTSASFTSPIGVAVDGSGNVYVACSDSRIRKITPSGNVTTLAGSGITGSTDGQGASASFGSPLGVAVDESGNVYVADAYNNRIRKITPSGNVTTLAGSGITGSTDGQGASASFGYPLGLAVDRSGNVYVADLGSHRIRKITPSGNVTTLAGSDSQGYSDGQGASASFDRPRGAAVDGGGNVYVADLGNHRIRKITLSK
jgi:sugar lactone lactonase YvrE